MRICRYNTIQYNTIFVYTKNLISTVKFHYEESCENLWEIMKTYVENFNKVRALGLDWTNNIPQFPLFIDVDRCINLCFHQVFMFNIFT